MPLNLQPNRQRDRRDISILGTALSAATMASLNSKQQSVLHQNLNSMPMASLLQVRKQQLDGMENLGAILDGASIVPGVGSLFKMVNLFLKDQQGQSIADPYIAQTARTEIQHWREMLASQQNINFYEMATGLYQTAIDRAFDPLMPSNIKDSYQTFLFKSLSNTVLRLDGEAKDLSQGLSQLAPSTDLVRQTSIAEVQGFTSLVSENIRNIQTSIQILNKNVDINTAQIDLLKSQVSSLDLTIKNHEWRIDHLELISEAMFDEFKKVDTLGFERDSKNIAALKSNYDALLKDGSAEQIIAARTELTTGLRAYDISVKGWQQNIQWINGGASLVIGLAGALGKPEIQQAVQIIQGVAQVGLGIGAFMAQGALMTAMGGPVGAGIAIAGGIAAIYMSSKKSSGGGDGIGQALAQISQQIQALSEQIQRLGLHIDNRFDQVEDLIHILSDRNEQLIMRTFESIVDLLDEFRQNVVKQFIATQGKLDSMGVLLNILSNKLDQVLAVADAGFRTLYQGQDRYARTLAVVRYYENQIYGQVPSLQTRELRDALLALADWASSDAKHPVFHRDLGNDYSLAALGQVPPDEFWNAVNLIVGFIRSSQGLGLTLDEKPLSANLTRPLLDVTCAPETLTQRVVNPAVWQEVVGYLQRFALTLPEMQFLPNDRCFIQRIITSAESFLRIVLALRTHPDIFPRLITRYNTAFEQWLGLMYGQVLKGLAITPADIWTEMQVVQGKLGDVLNLLNQLKTSLTILQSNAQAMMDLTISTCLVFKSPLNKDGSDPYPTLSKMLCYDGNSSVNFYGKAYSLDYTDLANCHANTNYRLITEIISNLAIFITTMLKNNIVAFQMLDQTLSTYHWNLMLQNLQQENKDITYCNLLSNLTAVNLLTTNHSITGLTDSLTGLFEKTSSNLHELSKVSTCYFFAYIYAGLKDMLLINYGDNQYPQFSGYFNTLTREFSTKTGDLYNQVIERYNLYIQAQTVLFKKLTLTQQLGLDIGLFNANISMPNITFPEDAPLAQKRLALLTNFVANHAGSEELAAVARALAAMKDTPAAIIAQTNMEQHRHALSLILPLAFNEEFYADPIIQEMLRVLWSGDQFKVALDAFDSRDNTTFSLNSLQQSFFPTYEGGSYQLLALMKDYLNQTIVRGQEALQAGNLSPGYFELNQLLEQLYLLRDVLIGVAEPTTTSTLSSTRGSSAASIASSTIHTPNLGTTQQTTKQSSTSTAIHQELAHTSTLSSTRSSSTASKTPAQPSKSTAAPIVSPTTHTPNLGTTQEIIRQSSTSTVTHQELIQGSQPENINTPPASSSGLSEGTIIVIAGIAALAFVSAVFLIMRKYNAQEQHIRREALGGDPPLAVLNRALVQLGLVALAAENVPETSAALFDSSFITASVQANVLTLPINLQAQPQTNNRFSLPMSFGLWYDQAALYINTSEYQVIILERQSPGLAVTGKIPLIDRDTYTKSSCVPVAVYGNPAVICEGERTTLIYYATELPPHLHVGNYLKNLGLNTVAADILMQPFSDPMGQLMLSQVALHLGSTVWNAIRNRMQNKTAILTVKRLPVTNPLVVDLFAKIATLLTALGSTLETAKQNCPNTDWKWESLSLDDYQQDYLNHKKKKTVALGDLIELQTDISCFSKHLIECYRESCLGFTAFDQDFDHLQKRFARAAQENRLDEQALVHWGNALVNVKTRLDAIRDHSLNPVEDLTLLNLHFKNIAKLLDQALQIKPISWMDALYSMFSHQGASRVKSTPYNAVQTNVTERGLAYGSLFRTARSSVLVIAEQKGQNLQIKNGVRH